MEKYISLDALVAEIERLIDSHKPLKTLDPTYCEGLDDSLDDVLSFIDTLEVKEVKDEPVSNDLEKAAVLYNKKINFVVGGEVPNQDFIAGAQWQKDHTCFAGRTKTIEEIKEALLSEVLPCFMHGGEADEVVAKLDEVLNKK